MFEFLNFLKLLYFLFSSLTLFILKDNFYECRVKIELFVFINILYQLFLYIFSYADGNIKNEANLISIINFILFSNCIVSKNICNDIESILYSQGILTGVCLYYYIVKFVFKGD